jgi:hypothetical protein
MYVVIAKNDKDKDPNGEIIFEQYTKDATIEKCEEFIKHLGNRYGETRIAKVVELKTK